MMDDESGLFPHDFLWGVATSAHQVEGGNYNNQWTAWERAGRTHNGATSGLACDWWNRAEADFALAESLGVNSLRLSVEWSRIEPEPGRFSASALARYRDMLLDLKRRRIRPFITLHHFTHPHWFEDRGGFLADDSPERFLRFSERVVNELGELCSDWVTVNEPNVFTALGYCLGQFPPGRRGKVLQAAQVTMNLCRSHALIYHSIHRMQPHANVGWAQHCVFLAPRDPSSRIDRRICRTHDRLFNENFIETLTSGRAPFPLNLLGKTLPEVVGTFDFIGINYYSRLRARFLMKYWASFFVELSVLEDAVQSDSGVKVPYGEIYPEGMGSFVRRFQAAGKPIYILENGVADRDDRIRSSVIESSVEQMKKLLREGCDLRGYFHWSLLDNFEWNEGWHLRFGLVELDPRTQARKLRPSAETFSSAIAAARRAVTTLG